MIWIHFDLLFYIRPMTRCCCVLNFFSIIYKLGLTTNKQQKSKQTNTHEYTTTHTYLVVFPKRIKWKKNCLNGRKKSSKDNRMANKNQISFMHEPFYWALFVVFSLSHSRFFSISLSLPIHTSHFFFECWYVFYFQNDPLL